MDEKIFGFDFRDLRPDINRVEKLLGCDSVDPEQTIGVLIEEIVSDCENIAGIKAEYRIFNEIGFDNQEKNICINGIFLNIGTVIFKQLKGVQSLALFLCTAGNELSARVSRNPK